MTRQCSDLFLDVFDSGCGGCIRTCECGIIHFDGFNEWDWKEGELEALQEKAKKHPGRYVEKDCAIGTLSIDGIEIVYDCTCDLARKYEQFIISYGARLADYLNKRAELLRQNAEIIEVKVE